MNAIKMTAIAFLVAGILALAYRGFSYTKDTHQAQVGPVDIVVRDTQTVNIPGWAGAAAVLVGLLLLSVREKKV